MRYVRQNPCSLVRLVILAAVAHIASCATDTRVERAVVHESQTSIVMHPAPVPMVEVSPVAPTPVTSQSAYENEIKLVETLLTKSSAAKLVLTRGDPAAIAEMDKAKQLLQMAKESDAQRGAALLAQAKRTLFAALKMGAAPASAHDGSEYSALAKTTRVLLDAYRRILQEKSLDDTGGIEAEVRAKLDLVETYAEQSDSARAEQTADAAFHRVREAVVALRGGDTLIRSLHFESPADEYRYEVDRNQTHELLVKLLVQKQSLLAAELENIQRSLDTARQLREQAEAQAGERNFSSAIKALEESTQHIIRAIRAAGVYIPG